MAEISTSTVKIIDLPTKSVTITPQRATIVREIHTSIQIGQHTLTITGLDPQVDTDSILIEGTGTATITDIQTSIVPRQDKFEDVYPLESDSESEPDSVESETDSSLGHDDENAELQAISRSIAEVEARLARAQHEQAMAVSVQGILDEYAKKMNPESVDANTLEGFLGVYTRQRVDGHQRYHQAGVEVGEGEKELARLVKRRGQVEGRLKREREVASKKERREKEKRAIERARKTEQRKMERDERFKFWTVRVGQVVVHLDSQAGFMPGSSRRSSIVEPLSVGETSSEPSPSEPVDVMLRLSYVVPGVSWSSRYELRINTPSSSARMAYRAEFRNSSSETWTDARVTLSTSQASFSGLEQRIPSLHPWHIKLLDAIQANQEHPSWERILRGGYAIRPIQAVKTSGLFGNTAAQPQQSSGFGGFGQKKTGLSLFGNAAAQNQNSSGPLFGKAQSSTASAFGSASNQDQPSSSGGLFGGTAQAPLASNQASNTGAAPDQAQQVSSGGLFGSGRGLFGRAPAAEPAHNPTPQEPSSIEYAHEDADDNEEDREDEHENDIDTIASASLEHQESVKQDYGLTTTYDLPGQRTLIPSTNNRRHNLADLDLKSVTLSHIIVPKHSAEAFFRARVKNTSSLRIVRGRVGLTVDGTFLGTATIPNCAPGDFFNVSLGVDPSILVTYGKPTVRRLNTGFFTGHAGAVFRRTCWIKNTKGVAVDITVLDQVPVSEDKELQVEILEPKGLQEKGNEVKLDMEASHGSGKVIMEKKGEVKWVIHLEPGKDVRVVLEYGTKAPRGSEVDSA